MKFSEFTKENRSPRIETMVVYKDILFLASSDGVYAVNLQNNKIEEVEFEK